MSLESVKELINEYASNLTYTEECPDIVPTGGIASWTINHGLSTSNVIVGLFNEAGEEVKKQLEILTANEIRVSWVSDSPVTAGEYSVLVVSGGASSGIIVDSTFSLISTNPVQNATITEAIGTVEETLHNLNSGDGAHDNI